MRQIRLIVEYDGTGLCGWQRQTNGPTVQQHLEEALGQILDGEVAVTGASRTDAGVHSRGQVACFRTERAIPLEGLRMGLNSILPPQIAVRDADEVDETFHPRFSARGKHYRYSLWTRRDRSPLWAGRAWHRSRLRDLDAMVEASRALLGEHDFAAFRAAGCTARTTVRIITAIDVSRPEPDLAVVDVRGTAFLRHMVRILVGTLVEVAEGRRPIAEVREILESRDRTRGGQTAPAHGLELMSVSYV